ncbi:hypothetical protein DEV92_105270 [Phyllobacterium myrsinacearum]|nr:hypothetical protein DEV92_105270 [Phyllobacterium myrsinacearum]RZV05985.1 hypothetical protein EV654_3434 [Phyllobacterium myrsinacearum]
MSWHERICEKTVIPDRYAEITPLPANTFIARAAATLMVDGLFQVRNIAVILCSYLDD